MIQPKRGKKSFLAYLSALEMVEKGVLLINQSGEIVAANQFALKDLSYQKERIIEKSIFKVNPNYSLLSWKSLWRRIEEETCIEQETELITKSNIVYPVKVNLRLISIDKNKFCCYLIENLLETNRYQDLLTLTSRIARIGSWEFDLVKGRMTLTKEAFNVLNLAKPKYNISRRFVLHWLINNLERADYKELFELSRRAIETGEAFELEVSLLSEKKRFFITGEPQFIEEKAAKIYGAIQDVSMTSARSDEMYMSQFTVDNALEMIFWLRKDASLSYVNRAVSAQLGYTKQELIQMRLFDISPGLSTEAWESRWQALKKNKALEFESIKKTKSGDLLPVNVSSHFIQFQGQEYNCVFIRKIGVKKLQDELLKLTHYTLNQSNDMVFWVRKDGSFIYFNETAHQRLGYRRKELENLKLYDIYNELSVERLEATWEQLAEKKSIEGEYMLSHKGGTLFPVEEVISQVRFQQQECACVILRDITQRKKKEAEILRASKQIQVLKERLEEEKTYLQEEVSSRHNFNEIISKSPNYKKVMRQVAQVADTDSTVLILGETGTGKELLARAIHNLSDRSDLAMIKVNCAALPETLIESELFGHEKGAFTGAFQAKKGRFELANKGTIFLDEIGEMPLELQAKLLRVLQEGEFQRLGGVATQKVDVRIIAATNRNLEQLVEQKQFREDLYYRLNVFPIYNIPLRERKEDISPLIQHFVRKHSEKTGRSIKKIPQSSVERLYTYEFPGNIRELENLVERAVILSVGDVLNLDAVFPDLKRKSGRKVKHFQKLEELQRQHIIEALRRTNWKVTGKQSASEILGLNGKTLASKMRKLGIRRTDFLDI